MATPISLHSTSTALSNASADDLRHRSYEDFGESDDDLRREEIFLLTDAGMYLAWYMVHRCNKKVFLKL